MNTEHFRNQVKVAWKWVMSFRKPDWELSDYPIVVREQHPDFVYPGARRKFPRFAARILRWELSGAADSEIEALQELARNFEKAKSEKADAGKPLPRPGTSVSLEFAPQERIKAHLELADDFTKRVLEADWVWISDESSLWDFHGDETNSVLLARIKEIYGVDVSDIQSARLYEIFDRIAEVRSGTTS